MLWGTPKVVFGLFAAFSSNSYYSNEAWETLLNKHIGSALEKQNFFLDYLDELGSPDWFFDIPGLGKLELGANIAYDVKMIGTDSDWSKSFEWAWASPPDFDFEERLLCTELKDHPEIQDCIDIFQSTEEIPLTDTLNGHAIALVAGSILNAKAVFIGPYDEGQFYLLVTDRNFPSFQERVVERKSPRERLSAFAKMTRLPFVSNHRLAFTSFVEAVGATIKDETKSAVIVAFNGTEDTMIATFDGNGRMEILGDQRIPSQEDMDKRLLQMLPPARENQREEQRPPPSPPRENNRCSRLLYDFPNMLRGGNVRNHKDGFISFAMSLNLMVSEGGNPYQMQAVDDVTGEAVLASFDEFDRLVDIQSVYRKPPQSYEDNGNGMFPPPFPEISPPERMAQTMSMLDPSVEDPRGMMFDLAMVLDMVTIEDGDNAVIARDPQSGTSVRVVFDASGNVEFVGFDELDGFDGNDGFDGHDGAEVIEHNGVDVEYDDYGYDDDEEDDDAEMELLTQAPEVPGTTLFDHVIQTAATVDRRADNARQRILDSARFHGLTILERGNAVLIKDVYSDRKMKIGLGRNGKIDFVKATPKEEIYGATDKMIKTMESLEGDDKDGREIMKDLASELGMFLKEEGDSVVVAQDPEFGHKVRVGFSHAGAVEFVGTDWAV